MKTYEKYIELSDAHVCWKLYNPRLNAEQSETVYQFLIDTAWRKFKEIYGTRFCMLGRSGRHICVENTPKNRQNYCRMKRTIERLQKEMIKTFNNATPDILN